MGSYHAPMPTLSSTALTAIRSRPALREVVALGFVEITEVGRAGNAEFRRPNFFRLTYRHTRYAPTDEWKKITEDEARFLARSARTVRSSKTKSQWGKIPIFGGGNPHRKPQIHTGETPTTSHTGETPTTLDISGRDAAHLEAASA